MLKANYLVKIDFSFQIKLQIRDLREILGRVRPLGLKKSAKTPSHKVRIKEVFFIEAKIREK